MPTTELRRLQGADSGITRNSQGGSHAAENRTGRRKGTRLSPAMPNGPISARRRLGVELKILAQKAGSVHEELVIMGNNMLALTSGLKAWRAQR